MSSGLCLLTFYLVKLSNLLKLWLEYIPRGLYLPDFFKKKQKKERNIVSIAITISRNNRLQVKKTLKNLSSRVKKMKKLSVCIVYFGEIHRSSLRKIELILNRPITKFYNSDDVNATELRQTNARLISF